MVANCYSPNLPQEAEGAITLRILVFGARFSVANLGAWGKVIVSMERRLIVVAIGRELGPGANGRYTDT